MGQTLLETLLEIRDGLIEFFYFLDLYLIPLPNEVASIGVRAGGAGGAAAPPVSKIFGQNAKNSGNKETINDGIGK